MKKTKRLNQDEQRRLKRKRIGAYAQEREGFLHWFPSNGIRYETEFPDIQVGVWSQVLFLAGSRLLRLGLLDEIEKDINESLTPQAMSFLVRFPAGARRLGIPRYVKYPDKRYIRVAATYPQLVRVLRHQGFDPEGVIQLVQGLEHGRAIQREILERLRRMPPEIRQGVVRSMMDAEAAAWMDEPLTLG